MATTEIHAITSTPNAALNYVMSDKVVEYTSDNDVHTDVPHEIFEDDGKKYVRYKTVASFLNCNPSKPMQSFKEKQKNGQDKFSKGGVGAKKGEPVMWHMHQSFNGREVDYITANEIGRKFAEDVFKNYTVVITTHTDGDNIHNHFMISAWDDTGHKYRDRHSDKRMIREVSDRLCKEYGLSVLENTADMKLTKYKDADGNTRFFEPTERKIELIKKRSAGETTKDDVNSYRNTPQYEQTQRKEQTNQEIIKQDIDTLLPSCRSYEELLQRLRELGYKIRDKKKNGDWLEHVAFQPPTAAKATRDYKIGDGVFYTRDNLTAYISEQMQNIETDLQRPRGEDENLKSIVPQNLPYFESYEYGRIDLAEINDNYRKTFDADNGTFSVVPRSPYEQKVITDIRRKDDRIKGLIDTTELNRIIAEQKIGKGSGQPSKPASETELLVAQIRASFQCLRYTEQHGLYSYGQMLDMYKANKDLYSRIVQQVRQVSTLIHTMENAAKVPSRAAEVQARMEANKNNVAYAIDGLHEDRKLLLQYESIMQKYKIDTPEGQAAFNVKVAEYADRLVKAQAAVANATRQMAEIENCVRTYDRIDRERGADNATFMREFNALVGDVDGAEEQRTRIGEEAEREQAARKRQKKRE